MQKIDGRVLWANLHLLFWLSLVPFVTAWMGEHPTAPYPVALYGAVLLFAGVAYYWLTLSLLANHGRDSKLAIAIGGDRKGKISLILYAVAIPFAFFKTWISYAIYVLVAIIWLVPDTRIERTLERN